MESHGAGRTASAACQYIPAVLVRDSLCESSAKDCTAGKERWWFWWDLLCNSNCTLWLLNTSSSKLLYWNSSLILDDVTERSGNGSGSSCEQDSDIELGWHRQVLLGGKEQPSAKEDPAFAILFLRY